MTAGLLTASAIVLNALFAGLLFAFVCAVSPAYRRLSDEEFVRGFRAINEAILRPSFLVVFFGAPLSALAAAVVGAGSVPLLWVGAAGSFASLVITMAVNVPLNRRIDRALIETAADRAAARTGFEARWNRWNLIRCWGSVVAALGFALALALG